MNQRMYGLTVALALLIGGSIFVFLMQSHVFGGGTINLNIDVNKDLDSGLVGHWTFDGSLANTIADSSGRGNDGYLGVGSEATSAMISPMIT